MVPLPATTAWQELDTEHFQFWSHTPLGISSELYSCGEGIDARHRVRENNFWRKIKDCFAVSTKAAYRTLKPLATSRARAKNFANRSEALARTSLLLWAVYSFLFGYKWMPLFRRSCQVFGFDPSVHAFIKSPLRFVESLLLARAKMQNTGRERFATDQTFPIILPCELNN